MANKANFHNYLETDLPMFWLFTNDSTPGASWNDYQHALLPLAERYRGRVAFLRYARGFGHILFLGFASVR